LRREGTVCISLATLRQKVNLILLLVFAFIQRHFRRQACAFMPLITKTSYEQDLLNLSMLSGEKYRQFLLFLCNVTKNQIISFVKSPQEVLFFE